MEENLNKENFWNALYLEHPDKVEKFCKWIDEYKKKNNWNALFNSDSNWQDANGKNAPAPKFHDLPVAIQVGIFGQFMAEWAEQNHASSGKAVSFREQAATAITRYFKEFM